MYVCVYGMVWYGTVRYGMVWYGMYVCIYTYIHIYMFFNCYIWLVEGNGGKSSPFPGQRFDLAACDTDDNEVGEVGWGPFSSRELK